MGRNSIDTELAIKRIKQEKVITVDELALLFDGSKRTARRRLKFWKAHTSYNLNGRYYTLPYIPTFNELGLWVYRGIRFSKYGNLKQTIICLVNHSDAGLDAAELADLLGIYVRSFLVYLRDAKDLKREKIQGRFIYFSAEEQIYAKQKDKRIFNTRTIHLPSDKEVIAILVTAIKYPHLSITELSLNLKEQKYHISSQMISDLFAYHGLALKKMPDSPS